jgi:translation initiation factor eIF-2B subunit delta
MSDNHISPLTQRLQRVKISLLVIIVIVGTLYFNMPSSNPATDPAGTENAPGGSITSKKEQDNKEATQPTKSPAAGGSGAIPKLSGAEIKAQKKAEKAARRQQEIQARQGGSTASTTASGGKPQLQNVQSQRGKGEAGAAQHRRTGSTAGDTRNVQSKGGQTTTNQPEEPRKEDKTVELFRHLYKTRATTISGASKEVHPAVLALGQQMSSYTVCGSNARLVATLQAFKRVSAGFLDLSVTIQVASFSFSTTFVKHL